MIAERGIQAASSVCQDDPGDACSDASIYETGSETRQPCAALILAEVFAIIEDTPRSSSRRTYRIEPPKNRENRPAARRPPGRGKLAPTFSERGGRIVTMWVRSPWHKSQ